MRLISNLRKRCRVNSGVPLLVLAFLGSGWSGCVATSGTLALESPRPGGRPDDRAYSEKVNVVSARLLTAKFRRAAADLPAIAVQVTNRGSGPFRFSVQSIQALADAAPVQVYHPHEYAELARREAEIESLAAEARQRGAIIRAIRDGGGPQADPLVTAKVAGLVEQTEVKDKQRRLTADATEMLHPGFVARGQTFGGVVRLKAAPLFSAQRLTLRITAGAEVHEIVFKVNP